MYPDRGKWDVWYAQVAGGNPKTFELKAQLSGLVINGDYATASYTLLRKGKDEPKPQKFERSFKLTKKEGAWKIAASLDKE
jgi:HSP20 family molecular chaperone IbpA